MNIFSSNAESLSTVIDRSKSTALPFVLPAETIYGFSAPLSSIEANQAIFRIKSRDNTKPFPVLVANVDMAMTLLDDAIENQAVLDTAAKFWLNSSSDQLYTLVLPANKHVNQLYTRDGSIAVRVATSDWLIDGISEPISSTSVNLSDQAHYDRFTDIVRDFSGSIEYFIRSDELGTESSDKQNSLSGKPSKIIKIGVDGSIVTLR